MSGALFVLLTVLKWLGIVLLCLLGLAALLLLLPVGADIAWRGGTAEVRLRVLCFSFSLDWLLKEEPADAPPPGGAPPAGPPAPHKFSRVHMLKENLNRALQTVPPEKARSLLEHVNKPMRWLLHGLRIRRLNVYWTVTGADAADTALQYGRLMAVLNGLLAAAHNLVSIRADRLWLEPDFTGEQAEKRQISCQITAQLYIIVAAAVYLLYLMLKNQG